MGLLCLCCGGVCCGGAAVSAAHTPGPWKLKLGKGIEYTYLVSAAKGQDVVNWAHYPNATKAETKANARLIAAAPDLLEALRDIASGTYDTWTEGYRAQQIARAAIAKATGATT